MPIHVEVDCLEDKRRDFYEVRDELLAAGKKFDRDALHHISYDQLVMCAIGNAGAAACSMKLVQEEKARRRERFLDMGVFELAECENYLRLEGMWDEIKALREMEGAPVWDDLSVRQKAWAKLLCVYNHIDNPHPRVGEAVLLLRKAQNEALLPSDLGTNMINRLKSLLSLYPGKITAELFRDKIFDVSQGICDAFSEQERMLLAGERIRDFRCTSDCFRV